jgi:hypothetical protein
MRHATWLRIERSPFWHNIYRRYRLLLPDRVRRKLRVLAMPRWHLAAYLVRCAARGRVMAGPFRGMRIELSPLSSRHLLGYLLGSQELELHEAIEHIATRDYRTILNIGAADGYYAVGLAMRLPDACIEAFEALPEFHPLIQRAAQANSVRQRIAIFGKCTVDLLNLRLASAAQPTLIVMDVEGAEVALLDLHAVPPLELADILVETHDAFAPAATEELIDRLGETHDVVCYTARPRRLDDFPAGVLPGLPAWLPRTAVELMNERRTGVQRWLMLWSKAAAAAVNTEAPGANHEIVDAGANDQVVE